jgi:leucyl-tRNA synthetase
MQQLGAEAAFKRQLLFSEVDVLNEILGYLKKSLSLVDAEVLTVDEALVRSEGNPQGYNKMIIESSEPGTPAFEFRNV